MQKRAAVAKLMGGIACTKMQYNPETSVLKRPKNFDCYWRRLLLVRIVCEFWMEGKVKIKTAVSAHKSTASALLVVSKVIEAVRLRDYATPWRASGKLT